MLAVYSCCSGANEARSLRGQRSSPYRASKSQISASCGKASTFLLHQIHVFSPPGRVHRACAVPGGSPCQSSQRRGAGCSLLRYLRGARGQMRTTRHARTCQTAPSNGTCAIVAGRAHCPPDLEFLGPPPVAPVSCLQCGQRSSASHLAGTRLWRSVGYLVSDATRCVGQQCVATRRCRCCEACKQVDGGPVAVAPVLPRAVRVHALGSRQQQYPRRRASLP
jgi:hypothetical protein